MARAAALPAGVLVAGWALSSFFYIWMDRERLHDDESHRENIIAGVGADLRLRLASFENALRTAAGDLGTSDHLKTPEDWHGFVDHLGLMTRFPGAEVMSVVQPVPEAESQAFVASERRKGLSDFNIRPMFRSSGSLGLTEHFVVICADPPRVAKRALGSDLATDPIRRAAAEAARDSGEPVLAHNTQLGENLGRGIQMFVPVYKSGLPLSTVEERRAALTAWVTVVITPDRFFRSAMRGQEKFVDLQVFDGALSSGNLLFSSNPAPAPGREFGRVTTLELDGVTWTLGWNRTPSFPYAARAASAWAAGFGALATLLVAGLMFRLQSIARRTETKLVVEQKRAEQTSAFLASLVQSSDDSIVGTTVDGIILTWNQGSQRLWGYTAEEVIGKHITMFFLPERRPEFLHGIEKVMRDEHIERYEAVRVRKDGALIDVSVILSPIKDAAGNLLGVSAIYSDITDQKRAAQELVRAKEAAEAANRSKSQFLANMSHEIRTPMNGILGMTEAVLDTELDSEQREYVNIAKLSAEALLTVINDILDFSKIEAGMLNLDMTEFAVRECVADAIKVLTLSARQKGIDLSYRFRDSLPDTVRGDALRIRQVLMNLVGNAVKFTPSGEVAVTVEATTTDASGCELRFAVRDTGIGIKPEKQPAIFAPFTQADGSTTRQYGGTGLGLTISKRLVEMMGGRIWFESEPNRGSTFFFTVPASVVEARQPEVLRA